MYFNIFEELVKLPPVQTSGNSSKILHCNVSRRVWEWECYSLASLLSPGSENSFYKFAADPTNLCWGQFSVCGIFRSLSQAQILILSDDDAVIVTKYTIRVFLPTAWLELSIISVIKSFINVAPMVPGPQPSSPQIKSDQSRLLRSGCI